jgi:hypothetical protein
VSPFVPALRAGSLVTALSLAAVLAACAPAPDQPSSGPTSAPVTTITPAATVNLPIADDQMQRPARYEVACIDHTSSLPPWFVERALQHVARHVEDAVTGPMRPAVFYLRSMSASSYAPEGEIATVELGAIPTPPGRPAPSANPFLTAEDRQRERVYERERAAWLAGLAASRKYAREAAGRIRALRLPVDTVGTDVLGCLFQAANLLGHEGERSLLVASDLIPHGHQQNVGPAPASLAGVQVTVAFYCTNLASACADRVAAVAGIVRQVGAADVSVVDAQNLSG